MSDPLCYDTRHRHGPIALRKVRLGLGRRCQRANCVTSRPALEPNTHGRMRPGPGVVDEGGAEVAPRRRVSTTKYSSSAAPLQVASPVATMVPPARCHQPVASKNICDLNLLSLQLDVD